jgi:GrpB-like predicted nucleotidyltransferase (UPF0157 family)
MYPDDEKYLSTLSNTEKVVINAFNPRTHQVANDILRKINEQGLDIETYFIGASALSLVGEGDVDLYAITDQSLYQNNKASLCQIFGTPLHEGTLFCEWLWNEGNIPVELYLSVRTENLSRQLKLFNLLKTNPSLQDEYESIKKACHKKSKYEYQKAKYEFYYKILNDETLTHE